MPVFAKKILHGGPQTYGFLMAAMVRGDHHWGHFSCLPEKRAGLGRIIVFASGIFGIGLISFLYLIFLWLSFSVLLLVALHDGADGVEQYDPPNHGG